MSKFELQESRLSESSDDESSSVTESEPPRKRQRSAFSLGGTDRSSTDHSLVDDDCQLSDEDDSPPRQHHADSNVMDSLVKQAKPKGFVDNKAQKMMERMGYRAGLGLGKHDQGRVDPVEMSLQRGRRGLGLHIKGLEPANLEWDSSLEVTSVEEEVMWLEDHNHETLTQDILTGWIKEGTKKLTIDDETTFCDPGLLRNVLSSKISSTTFLGIPPSEHPGDSTRKPVIQLHQSAFLKNDQSTSIYVF